MTTENTNTEVTATEQTQKKRLNEKVLGVG